MPVRGIRGATTVDLNTEEDILEATRSLLEEMVTANDVDPDDLAHVIVHDQGQRHCYDYGKNPFADFFGQALRLSLLIRVYSPCPPGSFVLHTDPS